MNQASQKWTFEKSADLYNLPGWGSPYFEASEDGLLHVRPDGVGGPSVALTDVVEMARQLGMALPLLIRFDGILAHRLSCLRDAFCTAASEHGYTGRYRPVYPIKVNQQRSVVEGLLSAGGGQESRPGLEVGSKPEMLAVVALLEQPSLIICNGYKDESYMESAVLATRLGHEVVVVIEKPSEVETISRVVEREGRDVCPWLGVRSRLVAQGSGRWESSAGDRAKFGLSASQLVECVDWLKNVELIDRVRLLHFHLGSQLTAIRPWKAALNEASRVYVELRAMGCPLNILDVGGGLAVDYDGSRTNFSSSRNYTEQEYANDVVFQIQSACQSANQPVPDIVTEAGRALVAHHSMMVVEVTGSSRLSRDGLLEEAKSDEADIVLSFRENIARLSVKTVLEVYHDALSLREELLSRFKLGLVNLPTRALCENLFFATCDRVASLVKTLDSVPEELEGLHRRIADIYFCNFSVFQSVPDHWAIRQIFPVMPIHRLDEEPTEHAVLGDMTCDSDGRIDRFADHREVKEVLEVHRLREGERYMLGIFLIGAYQETLGDLHNLFGDTDTVHVGFDAEGKPTFTHAVQGEPVGKVLDYVGYDEAWLTERYDAALARLVESGALTEVDAVVIRRDLAHGLADNTYLTERSVRSVRADDLAEDDEDSNEVAAVKVAPVTESSKELRDEGPLASSAGVGD
ncbi:MAG: biosynthetic arginine decarboxylase [Planctomycetota bacterium]|nr:biosynthetic arginine decarboxylase [Planctomycetota bacterium]